MADLRTAHRILIEMFAEDPEPMPPWETGNLALLETCCECSEVQAFGVPKYPDLVAKAAKLFYSGVKLHCFPNGNKRFGVVVAITFLVRNGHYLIAPPGDIRDLAQYVAETKPTEPEGRPDVIVQELIGHFSQMVRKGRPPPLRGT
jgi:death-on-curing protein